MSDLNKLTIAGARDALAKPVDMLANPIGYITNIRLRNSLTGSKLVDTRANLLEVTDRLDESALDKYNMLIGRVLLQRTPIVVHHIHFLPTYHYLPYTSPTHHNL